jgi:fructan beta-fructosidase
MGWMSNWQYANEVPTETWRSAMTIARELELKQTGESYRITSTPVKELDSYKAETITKQDIKVESETELHQKWETTLSSAIIEINIAELKDQDYSFHLKNETGDLLEFGYDAKEAQYYIDRSKAGLTDFNDDFAAKRSVAPRISQTEDLKFTA